MNERMTDAAREGVGLVSDNSQRFYYIIVTKMYNELGMAVKNY